jgi:hypothetical protein
MNDGFVCPSVAHGHCGRGAKGASQTRCGVRGKESRLAETHTAETHTTEERWSGDALPEKLTELRQKLGQEAKQEPKFGLYALSGFMQIRGVKDPIHLGFSSEGGGVFICSSRALPSSVFPSAMRVWPSKYLPEELLGSIDKPRLRMPSAFSQLCCLK